MNNPVGRTASIPHEAIHAAALAVFTKTYEAADWNVIANQIKAPYLRDAKLALEAAAPYIMREAYDAGARVAWAAAEQALKPSATRPGIGG